MNGILLVDKPKKCTSHDVVYKVKNIYKEKVGHTGTLDPNATGVLPLLIGKATLISKYLSNHDKIYEATIYLGEKRDTGDSEGKVIEQKLVKKNLLSIENIEKLFKSLIGKHNQIPPMYSAIKVNGKKLYEYARKGQVVQRNFRQIEIYKIDLLNINENLITFKVSCSKGTYIRSLCEEIAEKLETVGYMKELRRIQVGNFNIKDTIAINELEINKENNNFLKSKLISIEKIFENKEKIILENEKLKLFLNGVKVYYNLDDNLYKIYDKYGKFIGVGILEKNKLKRDIIV